MKDTFKQQFAKALRLNNDEWEAVEKEGQTIEEYCEAARMIIKPKLKELFEDIKDEENEENAEYISQIVKKEWMRRHQKYEQAEKQNIDELEEIESDIKHYYETLEDVKLDILTNEETGFYSAGPVGECYKEIDEAKKEYYSKMLNLLAKLKHKITIMEEEKDETPKGISDEDGITLYDPFNDLGLAIEKYGEEEGTKRVLEDCRRMLTAFYNNEISLNAFELSILIDMQRFYEMHADIKELNLKYYNIFKID